MLRCVAGPLHLTLAHPCSQVDVRPIAYPGGRNHASAHIAAARRAYADIVLQYAGCIFWHLSIVTSPTTRECRNDHQADYFWCFCISATAIIGWSRRAGARPHQVHRSCQSFAARTWPPQSFVNDKNELDGFDVDVAKEIAKRLGANIEFVTPEWSVITAGHWMDRWDMSVGSMTPTIARAEVLSFPGIYYYTPAAFAVHAESKATDKDELNGKTIGVVAPSTFEQYLNGDLVIDAEGTPDITYDVKPTAVVTMPNNQQSLLPRTRNLLQAFSILVTPYTTLALCDLAGAIA